MGPSTLQFDVLDPKERIDEHALLEASAGTGKTFSIEHLVARLVLSGIRIDEILLLTFTKKAAKELKERVRENLRKLLKAFDEEVEAPPYLERNRESKERIQFALFEFDFSPISTIHSFASRLLDEIQDFSHEDVRETLVTDRDIKELALRFLRFGVSEEVISKEALDLLLKECRGKSETLIEKLALDAARKETIKFEKSSSDEYVKLASLFQDYFRKWKVKHKKYTHDDMLLLLKERLKSPLFLEEVRRSIRAVIIDEFQDTDSLQWEIFETLFLEDPLKRSKVYLVGDPKQAIYAFRGADIYTYLAALKKTKRRLSLKTNWRSSPALVEALNRFFEKREIPLPKIEESISIESVAPGKKEEGALLPGKGALHILLLKGTKRGRAFPLRSDEEKLLFAFAEDLLRYVRELKVPLSKCAVLVKDRNQGERVKELFETIGILSSFKRQERLSETDSFFFLKQLFLLLEEPENFDLLRAVLVSPLFEVPIKTMEALSVEDFTESSEKIAMLKETFETSGPFAMMRQLGSYSFFGERVKIKEPSSFFQILEKIALSLNHPKKAFDEIEKEEMRHQKVEPEEALQILTIHASKGLEFEIVFPLGVISRSYPKERFIQVGDALFPLDSKVAEKELLHKEEEILSEKIRLLYVAMTRAKRALYLPIVKAENEKKRPFVKELSLIEAFLTGEEDLSFFSMEEVVEEKRPVPLEKKKSLEAPQLSKVERKYTSFPTLSFTALAKGGGAHSPPKGIYPHGSEVGRLIHHLFEVVSWGEVDLEKIRQEITPHLFGTPLEGWVEETARMIQSAFLAPLGGFSLKDVKESAILREVSFLYKEEGRFIKGVIDLIFSYEGELYLLDWKSNWLESYTEEALQEAMERESYMLQMQLYHEALKRYLQQLGIRRPPKAVFYLFLRGLEEGKGVFRCDAL